MIEQIKEAENYGYISKAEATQIAKVYFANELHLDTMPRTHVKELLAPTKYEDAYSREDWG